MDAGRSRSRPHPAGAPPGGKAQSTADFQNAPPARSCRGNCLGQNARRRPDQPNNGHPASDIPASVASPCGSNIAVVQQRTNHKIVAAEHEGLVLDLVARDCVVHFWQCTRLSGEKRQCRAIVPEKRRDDCITPKGSWAKSSTDAPFGGKPPKTPRHC